LQVKLCDPCLSALCVPWCKKALYKYSSFPFLYCLLQCSYILRAVVDDTKCIVVTRVCLCMSVCLSVRGRTPTLLHGPDVTWRHGRGCPLVVHFWADLQSVHGLRCYGNITRTLVTSLRLCRDMTT